MLWWYYYSGGLTRHLTLQFRFRSLKLVVLKLFGVSDSLLLLSFIYVSANLPSKLADGVSTSKLPLQ